MKCQAGFTLIELLLSVAILMIITGVTVPLYESFIGRNDLEVSTEVLAGTLRRAATYARSENYSNTWGVEIQTTAVTLFQGTSFSGRNTGYDEVYSLPADVSPSGLGEVQFTKFTGLPNVTGTITLTSSSNTKTVAVNAQGLVSY